MSERFAIIAGGGTAGHVHPGLAVARALVARGHDVSSILYVGSEHGIERELVPQAGFDLVTLPGRGIPRRVSPAALKAAASLVHGMWRGWRLLGHEPARVVLSLGGFAALPCALGARLRRVPVVIHEQNAVPGAANRLIGRWSTSATVSFPGTPLPNAVVTGNPVRPEMLAIARATMRDSARAALGVREGQKLLVVTGGSLGALRLNNAAIQAAHLWRDRGDLMIRHVVGSRDWEPLQPQRDSIDGAISYVPVEYESDMPTVFCAADLVVSRAGASTTAELAVVGVPSILVPLPGAPGDHQTANAKALVDAGGARMVSDDELDGPALARVAGELLGDDAVLASMGEAAQTLGRRDAADEVARLMEDHAA